MKAIEQWKIEEMLISAGIKTREEVRVDLAPEPVTRQTIFDRVVRHYRAQPRRCPTTGSGLYRGDDCDGCFARPLIDDAHYDPDMEGYVVRDLLKVFAMPQWFNDNIDFIEELQRLHDTETNWPAGRMDMVLEEFATEHGLTLLA